MDWLTAKVSLATLANHNPALARHVPRSLAAADVSASAAPAGAYTRPLLTST
jgi:hypothetical protein